MRQAPEHSARCQTALATITLIQSSAVLDFTEADSDLLTSNKVWIAPARSRTLRELVGLVEGVLARRHRGFAHAELRQLAYRVGVGVHVEARGKMPVVGMFGRRSHEPVNVESCVVVDPSLERARTLLPK